MLEVLFNISLLFWSDIRHIIPFLDRLIWIFFSNSFRIKWKKNSISLIEWISNDYRLFFSLMGNFFCLWSDQIAREKILFSLQDRYKLDQMSKWREKYFFFLSPNDFIRFVLRFDVGCDCVGSSWLWSWMLVEWLLFFQWIIVIIIIMIIIVNPWNQKKKIDG